MSKGKIGMLMMVVSALAVAGGIFFMVGAENTPVGALLAEVGVAVGVAPNPYNTLNEELNAKQLQLNMEAADLAAQKAALASDTSAAASTAVTGGPSPWYWYLTIAIGVVAFITGLNLHLGSRKEERERTLAQGRPGVA